VIHMRTTSNTVLLTSAIALVAFIACSDDGNDPAPTGPKGGIIEVDNHDIALGEDDDGGAGPVATGGTGGKPAAGASDIGKACEGDAGCEGGLTCRRDTADYIAHLQCSAYCDSSEQCAAIDAKSFCIGAHACVHECTTSADCGPMTRCNDSGWCERKGPGSGVSYCTGSPLPCSLQTGTSCLLTLGCSDDSDCGGVASSCYLKLDSFSCSQQDGCYWSSSSQDCSGSARSCSGMFSRFSCENQDGCYYTERCSGSPLSCESLSLELCANQPGCRIEEG
jgi:hypothetical protein